MKAQAATFNKEMQREGGGVLRDTRGNGGAEKDLLQQNIAKRGSLNNGDEWGSRS